MEMARFKISEEEYKELYRIEKATKDKKISQRLRVVMMRYEGKKVREIAEALNLNQQSISRICARYRKEGVEAFARNKYTSHHRYLSKEEESEILERFLLLCQYFAQTKVSKTRTKRGTGWTGGAV